MLIAPRTMAPINQTDPRQSGIPVLTSINPTTMGGTCTMTATAAKAAKGLPHNISLMPLHKTAAMVNKLGSLASESLSMVSRVKNQSRNKKECKKEDTEMRDRLFCLFHSGRLKDRRETNCGTEMEEADS
jgi:hypothetical protein